MYQTKGGDEYGEAAEIAPTDAVPTPLAPREAILYTTWGRYLG